MIKAIFWDFFGVINIDGKLNQDAANFIKNNSKKYTFAILSASNVDLEPWLKENGILEYFSLVQTTSELGLSKTDPKFYQNALNELNLKPSEVLFIADIESYLKVGRSIDIITLLYDYKDKISTQLAELLSK